MFHRLIQQCNSLNVVTSINKANWVDGENNSIVCDVTSQVRAGQFLDTLCHIKAEYGSDFFLLPVSGSSAGGAVFKVKRPQKGVVVGLKIQAAVKPKIRQGVVNNITRLQLDQIVIDPVSCSIWAGASITLEQLNNSLADQLSSEYRVLGADLTSYSYAQVGATFMTGGMGPQRRYFSDSVTEISLYDGASLKIINGDSLGGYAGTYGWTGIVTAVKCQFVKLPKNEIAFTIPVNSKPEELAALLAYLSPYTRLTVCDNMLRSEKQGNLILGIEHITTKAMQPMFNAGIESEITRYAQKLAEKSAKAGADGLVFINGVCDTPIDDFLVGLIDDPNVSDPTIAGVQIGYTEVFKNSALMRNIREAVPFAARTQSPRGSFVSKGHTDANIVLNPVNLEQAIINYWKINMDYVKAVQSYFIETQGVQGEIIIYGHLNPVGIDPHNRITFSCEDKAVFDKTQVHLEKLKKEYFLSVQQFCQQTGAKFIGGEKSAGSESEMFPAFGGPENAPPALRQKFLQQLKTIQASNKIFNWRALNDYLKTY